MIRENKKYILKFIFFSMLGIGIFLFPIKYQGEYNVLIGIMSDWIKAIMLPYAYEFLILVSTIGILASIYFKYLKKSSKLIFKNIFIKGKIDFIIKIVAFLILIMCYFKMGPNFIIEDKTGQTMIELLKTLIAWFLIASFLMPLLTNYGLMEFVGSIMSRYTKKIFLIPGRATVDLLASWIGNCNVGVVLTTQQYERGYYTRREATIIATCFSSVSLPFCLVISAMIGIKDLFIQYYFTAFITSVFLAIILSRIPPISLIEDEYYKEVGKRIIDEVDENKKSYILALENAIISVKKAPDLKTFFIEGIRLYFDILFTLTPYVMVFGTIALILNYHTNIFYYISLPMVFILKLFNIPNAIAVAPATLVGFIDMIIPVIIGAKIISVKAKFLIAVLSTVQIVYMTEVGALLASSKLRLNIFILFMIFLERTIIAIPIVVVFMKIFNIN